MVMVFNLHVARFFPRQQFSNSARASESLEKRNPTDAYGARGGVS